MQQMIQIYRLARNLLSLHQSTHFKAGTVVEVDHAKYKGFGIVPLRRDLEFDKIQVLLENENTFFFEMETCTPSPQRKNWPAWIKRHFMRQAGLKAERTRRLHHVE